jgi:sugar lactone lactonase YvrE
MVSSRRIVVVALALVGAGCGGSTKVGTGDAAPVADASPPDAAAPEGVPACPAAGEDGKVTVAFKGLPAGAAGEAVFRGDGAQDFSVTSGDSHPIKVGTYTVWGARVALSDLLVRTAYTPTTLSQRFCVHGGEALSFTIEYVPIASSGKLWVGNGLGEADMLGYAPSVLGASGAPAATVAAKTVGSDGFTFDNGGGLWVLGGTTADPPIARYAPAMLGTGTSGARTPAIVIRSDIFNGGSPGAKVLAFDRDSNLWVSVVYARKVVRLAASQLAASGSPVPAVELGGIEGPSGLAFDAAGNLFVASGAKKVLRFDKAHLASSTSAPDLAIGARSPPPVIGDLPDPQGLAFDKDGNLWVNFGGTLVRLAPADLAGTGTKTLTPAIQIQTDVLALPQGMALDEGGGLWLAYSKGKFGRLAPAQLTASGQVAPSVVITSPDVGYAGWFALYPGATGLPLYHSTLDTGIPAR